MTIGIFLAFVLFVVGLSFYLGTRTKTSTSYYAAGGQIHWAVNGIAFAGDYLSAASFLGICGMIATIGYDGFLYSIGYLAGWIVALFVVAEPLKRLGKYTFTDALDAKFNNKGIKLAAAISTLVVSICYLIPQMVGAGVLVEPLLGIAQHWGVIIVGLVVITIVATAGMASTTYVQFLKGAMLIVFSLVLVCAICWRGFTTKPEPQGIPTYSYRTLTATESGGEITVSEPGWTVEEVKEVKAAKSSFARLSDGTTTNWWHMVKTEEGLRLDEGQAVVKGSNGQKTINGSPESDTNKLRTVGNLELLRGEKSEVQKSVSPFEFLAALTDSKTIIRHWKEVAFTDSTGASVTAYYPVTSPGNQFMRPGTKLKVQGTFLERLDFLSLMLALFLGTAALPHILIRYYTVANPAAARKSTIVAIAAIGFFYILTLFMGLGAAINGAMNPADSNMAAPLLARTFSEVLFAVISAIAFATVLGTVAGLIIAASGAVAHDFIDRYLDRKMDDKAKIKAGKLAAFAVGFLAIGLGIIFKGVNASFLVSLAFAVAASANLPSIVMLLFWKRTTAQGITASIITGIVSSMLLISLSPDLFKLYGLDPTTAPIPISNPGIVSIPLSFMVLILVSLATPKVDHLEPAQ